MMDEQLIDLFSELNSEAALRARFVTPRQPESNYVEFKEKSDSRIPNLAEGDKRNFSKALSAFSNSGGGILIWGIRTHTKDGRDVAWTLKPIKQVEDMAERLRSSLLDTLMPQNPQVRIEAIANRIGNGYIKCLIPPSESRPHRAMADREYWMRLDGRSVRLEHYIIRDMMLRQAYPDLQFSAVTDPQADLPENQIKIRFRILNSGRAVAKYAGWFASIQNAKIISASGCEDQSVANNGRPTLFWNASAGTVLHPNGIANQVGTLVLECLNMNIPIAMLIKVYCEGMATKNTSLSFTCPTPDKPVWHIPTRTD